MVLIGYTSLLRSLFQKRLMTGTVFRKWEASLTGFSGFILWEQVLTVSGMYTHTQTHTHTHRHTHRDTHTHTRKHMYIHLHKSDFKKPGCNYKPRAYLVYNYSRVVKHTLVTQGNSTEPT